MVVVAAGIDGDEAGRAVGQAVEWVLVRPVIDAEHDERPPLGPEHARVAAALGSLGHPGHGAVVAGGDGLGEAGGGVRNGIGRGEADRVEALGAGAVDDGRLQRGRIAQKSRSA